MKGVAASIFSWKFRFQYPTMDKPLIVEGKKLGSSSSDYLDNFYASLPARYLKNGKTKKLIELSGPPLPAWLLCTGQILVVAPEDSMDGMGEAEDRGQEDPQQPPPSRQPPRDQ